MYQTCRINHLYNIFFYNAYISMLLLTLHQDDVYAPKALDRFSAFTASLDYQSRDARNIRRRRIKVCRNS